MLKFYNSKTRLILTGSVVNGAFITKTWSSIPDQFNSKSLALKKLALKEGEASSSYYVQKSFLFK